MMGSPENNFQTMQNEAPAQGGLTVKNAPNPQMLGNALQKYGSSNTTDKSNDNDFQRFMQQFHANQQATDNSVNQMHQMSQQNMATPAGGGNTPYGLNPYAQGLNRPTNLQPQLPVQQPAQAVQY